MRRELLDLAADLARRGEPFALATVVAPQAARSRRRSATWRSSRATALPRLGRRELHAADRRSPRPRGRSPTASPALVALDPDPESQRRPGLTVFPMTCHSGGSVEIHIQPVLPAPRLLVFGVSPTARALARLAKAHGLRGVRGGSHRGRFRVPGRGRRRHGSAARCRGARRPAPVFAVVATQGQWDEDALARGRSPTSPTTSASWRARSASARCARFLAGKRAGGRARARSRTRPASTSARAAPEEIALSILAEIVKEQRAAAGRAGCPRRGQRAAPAEARRSRLRHDGARAPARATAPQHGGRDFYFCCAGCRERFLAAPERYLGRGEARR